MNRSTATNQANTRNQVRCVRLQTTTEDGEPAPVTPAAWSG